jgi:hypothetical protein
VNSQSLFSLNKGRASHISQTWSAFTNTTTPGQSALSSPMSALNHSPLIRNQSIPSSVSSNSIYSTVLTSLSSGNPIQTSKQHSQSFLFPPSDQSGVNEEDDNVFQGVPDAIHLDLNRLYDKPGKSLI